VKFGHIADLDRDIARDLRHRPATGLIGASQVPETIDYSVFAGPVWNQGGTSSCVGNATAKSLFARAGITGRPIPAPSRKGIYDVARLCDSPYQPMVDQGSRPAAAFLGMQDYGVVSEERWPLTDGNVNDLPSLDVFESALEALVPDYYRIAPASDVALQIRQALGRGYCPVFAMPVDDMYMRYDGSAVYPGLQSPPLGGHYQVITGCVPGALVVTIAGAPVGAATARRSSPTASSTPPQSATFSCRSRHR